jgi:hypothetical protein
MTELKKLFTSKNSASQRTLLARIASALGIALLSVFVVQMWGHGRAIPVAAQPSQSLPTVQDVGNEACLVCHNIPGLHITLPSGELLYLTVDEEVYASSVHGQLGHTCVECHTDISGFPHQPLLATTRRQFTLQLYRSCAECHQNEYETGLDSVHQVALAAGKSEAAVCTDCHGTHDIAPPDQPRTRILQTCEHCHSQISGLYRESVHGAALIDEGDLDVPSCIDCHEVHCTEGPSTCPFHLFSPDVCAHCHADPEMMEPYGISTDVFDTYVTDFHGTTVELFQATAPGQETNKPVCVDCHGVHDIQSTDDPESTVIKENLLPTCQKCHPDATTNFPSSWLNHYRPSLEHSPLVYLMNVFYGALIPTMIGGMLLFAGADTSRRLINRMRGRRHE